MLRLLVILALFLPGMAFAQPFRPCPYITGGWSVSYHSGPITSATYDETTKLLYIIFNSTIPTAFENVPTQTMQQLSSTTNPAPLYNQIATTYPSLLLNNTTNCPMAWEDGSFIVTNKVNPPLPPYIPCGQLVQGNGRFWNSSLTSAWYNSGLQVLWAVTGYNNVLLYIGVPAQTANALLSATNPSSIYATISGGQYHIAMADQPDACPLSYESGGFIWTR